MKINAIITAGGTSSRFGNKNKLLEKINGIEVIKHTVDMFRLPRIDKIIVCANVTIIDELQDIFKGYDNLDIIEGGETRQQSVYNGLKHEKCDYVLIHDGARPLITKELINTCIESVIDLKAISVMTKTIDTIKEVENGIIIKTIDRSKLYNTQTPQAFEYNLIMKAHQKYEGQNFTDDSGLAEAIGAKVYVVNGSYRNIKITTQSDMALAQAYFDNN